MLGFGLIILFLIIGIAISIIGCKNSWDCDWQIEVGIVISFVSGLLLIIALIALLTKPITYKNFKIEYDTIKETMTYKDDIRDATYTQNIININKQIRRCREYKDSNWLGIFQIEGICNAELLEKEAKED